MCLENKIHLFILASQQLDYRRLGPTRWPNWVRATMRTQSRSLDCCSGCFGIVDHIIIVIIHQDA